MNSSFSARFSVMLKSSEALTLQEQHITTPLAFSVAGPKIWNSLPSIGFALLRLLRHLNQDQKCTGSLLLNIHHDQDSLDLTTGNTTQIQSNHWLNLWLMPHALLKWLYRSSIIITLYSIYSPVLYFQQSSFHLCLSLFSTGDHLKQRIQNNYKEAEYFSTSVTHCFGTSSNLKAFRFGSSSNITMAIGNTLS